MPARKFSRVLRGQRGLAAKRQFLDYLNELGQDNEPVSTGKRRLRYIVGIDLFSIELGNEKLLRQTLLRESWDALNFPSVRSRLVSVLPAGVSDLKIKGAKAARVSACRGLSGTGTSQKSKLTGLYYLDYGGQSYSCPFGRATANEKQLQAFAAIKAELGSSMQRIHLIEERV
jgi:hypothetical protein